MTQTFLAVATRTVFAEEVASNRVGCAIRTRCRFCGRRRRHDIRQPWGWRIGPNPAVHLNAVHVYRDIAFRWVDQPVVVAAVHVPAERGAPIGNGCPGHHVLVGAGRSAAAEPAPSANPAAAMAPEVNAPTAMCLIILAVRRIIPATTSRGISCWLDASSVLRREVTVPRRSFSSVSGVPARQ